MLRWRMPSQTGDRRSARVGARRAAVCHDMLVTRSLGLGATGRERSKIHVRRRTTLTGRRGGVRAGGCGVGVEVEVKAIVGWGSHGV